MPHRTFHRLKNWGSFAFAGLLALAYAPPAEAQPRRSQPRRPSPTVVAPAAPATPRRLPRSGPACQALANNTLEGVDPSSMLAAAKQEALRTRDYDCQALVAAREISLGRCGEASLTLATAREAVPGSSFVRCVNGLATLCAVANRPTPNGMPQQCSDDVYNAVSDIAMHCEALDDPGIPSAAIQSMMDISQVCIDEGPFMVTAAVMAHWFDTQRNAPEFQIIRMHQPSQRLTDAVLLVKTRHWLENDAPSGITLPNLRLRLRDYLSRQQDAAGLVTAHDWNRIAAIGLVGTTSRMTAGEPGAFGLVIQDLLFIERIGMFSDPQVLRVAVSIQMGQAIRVPFRDSDARDAERLYAALDRSHAATPSLIRLRIGGIWAYQRPATPDRLSDDCRRAARQAQNLQDFLGTEYAGLPRAAYAEDVQVLAQDGLEANAHCTQPDPARSTWLQSLVTAIQTNGPLSRSSISFIGGGGR